MSRTFEVILQESVHPLHDLDKIDSYGFLMAGIRNLDETPLLDDVKGFYLDFFGGNSEDNYELWANPLRVKVLQRLSLSQWYLYLSIIGDVPYDSSPTGYIPIEKEMQNGVIQDEHLSYVVIKSPESYTEIHPRIFLEVPERLIPQIINRYWQRAYPGYPIQGLLMRPGQVARLRSWSEKPRNDHLFREIIDEVFVMFHTFPSENRHFLFLTNKLTLDDIKRLVDIDDLQKAADEIGNVF